jgi:hypothetical protein
MLPSSHARGLGRAYRGSSLLELIGAGLPEIGDEKDAVRTCECTLEGLRAIHVRQHDFLGECAMLARIAGQSAHLELAARLQGTYDAAALLPRCAGHGNEFSVV